MCFKELKFKDQSLRATIRINAVWFAYQDVSRILRSLYSDSAVQQAIAPMVHLTDDETFRVKTEDTDILVINDSAVFRWIERLNTENEFNENLDTFRRFISHSAIPTMYRDYYADTDSHTQYVQSGEVLEIKHDYARLKEAHIQLQSKVNELEAQMDKIIAVIGAVKRTINHNTSDL